MGETGPMSLAEIRVDSVQEMFEMIAPTKKWAIVAFVHPTQGRSVLYRQNLTIQELLQAVKKAIDKGANLLSIRGVDILEKKR